MAQFQNRCFSGPLTLDRNLTGGSDSGPLPHLANILVEYTRDHLAMERFRALLVKGLNLTAQPLLMEYEKEILRLAIFCKLFWD